MKIRKLTALFLCVGFVAWVSFGAMEDGSDSPNPVKTMEQAWKSALEKFGDDQENTKKVVDFYKSNFSEKIKYLEKEVKCDLERVVEELNADLGECSGLLGMKDDNPEEFKKSLEYIKLRVKTDLLGVKIHDLKEKDADKNKAEIEKAEKELKSELSKLFDMKLLREKDELKNLENDVEKLRHHIKQREENREKIIDKKIKDLTGVEENLEF